MLDQMKKIEVFRTSAKHPHLDKDAVKACADAFEFEAPDLEEQKLIAAVFSSMDDELEKLEERLNKTQQLKQGMMQELLTGRIRLV